MKNCGNKIVNSILEENVFQNVKPSSTAERLVVRILQNKRF